MEYIYSSSRPLSCRFFYNANTFIYKSYIFNININSIE